LAAFLSPEGEPESEPVPFAEVPESDLPFCVDGLPSAPFSALVLTSGPLRLSVR
jgi:hypothetical protein